MVIGTRRHGAVKKFESMVDAFKRKGGSEVLIFDLDTTVLKLGDHGRGFGHRKAQGDFTSCLKNRSIHVIKDLFGTHSEGIATKEGTFVVGVPSIDNEITQSQFDPCIIKEIVINAIKFRLVGVLTPVDSRN